MNAMLTNLISKVCQCFIDDIEIKKSIDRYVDEYVLSEVRKFIMKKLQNLNKMLTIIEVTENSVSGKKSQFMQKKIKLIDFVCEPGEMLSEISKVMKIVN